MAQVGQDPNVASTAKPKLFLFGRSNIVEIEGKKIRLPRLSLALCAFLLLDCPGHRTMRESAAQFLWEELRSDRQAGNMRQLLLRLRGIDAAIGLPLLETRDRGNALTLPVSALEIDVSLFQAARLANTEQRIVAICRAYTGDLLVNLNEKGERLAAWLTARRAVLHEQFVDAITGYLEGAEPFPTSNVAVLAAKRLIEVEPLQEAGYRALMRVHADRGDRDRVRDAHQALERVLARNSGAKPSPTTGELRDALLAKPRPAAILRDRAAVVSFPSVAARTPRVGDSRDVKLPRLGVMAYVAAASSRIDLNLVDELANNLATRIAQTRAMTVFAPWTEPPGAPSPVSSRLDYALALRPSQGSSRPAVSVRLVETSTHEILWATTYRPDDYRSDGVQPVLASILRHVEEKELQSSVFDPETQSAYRIVLEARRVLRTMDLPSIRKARRLFKAALIVNPEYVAALAGLARTHVMEWLVRAPFERDALDTAEEIARRAVAIDPDDYRGYHELGVVNTYFKRLDDSVECLTRAKRLSPDDVAVRADLADALIFNGQAAEAVELVNESKALPGPSDDYFHWILASVHFDRGDYAASVREIGMMANPAPAFRLSAAAHAVLGDNERARRVMRASMEFNPDFSLTSWLSLVPSRNRDCVQRYTEGLRLAGFV
jgi:DNA-binding SARP family transcriptional activator